MEVVKGRPPGVEVRDGPRVSGSVVKGRPPGVEVRDGPRVSGSVVKGRPPGVEVRDRPGLAGWGRGPQVRGQVRDRLGWSPSGSGRAGWDGDPWSRAGRLGWGPGGRSAGVGVRPPRTAVCGGSEGSGSVRGVEVRVWPRV